MMRKSAAVASAMIFLAVTEVAAKPTRSECIVGYSLDWSKVKNQHDARNSLAIEPTGDNRISALAGMILSDGGDRIYFQFRKDCEKKQALAESLISFWRKSGVDLPTFKRIDDPISPSVNTIDLRGPDWS